MKSEVAKRLKEILANKSQEQKQQEWAAIKALNLEGPCMSDVFLFCSSSKSRCKLFSWIRNSFNKYCWWNKLCFSCMKTQESPIQFINILFKESHIVFERPGNYSLNINFTPKGVVNKSLSQFLLNLKVNISDTDNAFHKYWNRIFFYLSTGCRYWRI